MGLDWGAEQEATLARLEEEERDLSGQRRMVHDRIDAFDGSESTEARELELSRRRRELHARIDALRARRDAGTVPPAA
jgi:hypothetical protein